MLQSYKTKSVHIQDQGLFTELARTLAQFFGRVTYHAPWVSGFPYSDQLEVGEGYPTVERVDHLEDIINETDLFVFPDTYYGSVQINLVESGKRVFGSRNGDELEIYRADAKKHFEKLGISQGPWKLIKGVGALRTYLKSRGEDKVWIKIEKTRGDTETFPVKGYELYKARIDDLELKLGLKSEIMLFIVEDNLAETIDIAADTFCIDGAFPTQTLLGTEEKGECYIGIVQSWDKLPPRLKEIYEALSPTLQSYEYRNFLSLESRVKGSKVFLGDPCCRFGSPPSEGQINMITNLPDIFWFGAEGKLIDPIYDGTVLVELCVHSDWANDKPLLVDFPTKYRSQIKFRYAAEFNGKIQIMPQHAGPRIASIVSHGNNIDKCIEECKEISNQLNGIQIESFTRGFYAIKENIEKLRSWSITF